MLVHLTGELIHTLGEAVPTVGIVCPGFSPPFRPNYVGAVVEAAVGAI